jgi:hypothetical protein
MSLDNPEPVPKPIEVGQETAALRRFYRDSRWEGWIHEGGMGPGTPKMKSIGRATFTPIQDGRRCPARARVQVARPHDRMAPMCSVAYQTNPGVRTEYHCWAFSGIDGCPLDRSILPLCLRWTVRTNGLPMIRCIADTGRRAPEGHRASPR